MKKILATLLGLGFALAGPSLALAAYNDVTLTTDANFSVNGVTINIVSSSAVLESVEVGATTMTVTLQPNSTMIIQAPGLNALSASLASGAAYTNVSVCHSSLSEMTFTPGASQSVVTVTPSTTSLCPVSTGGSGGSSGGGGGGGGSVGGGGGGGGELPTTPAVTAPAAVATTPTSSASISALVAQLQTLIAQLKALGGTVSPALEATIASLTGASASTGNFTRDLQLGTTGNDVKSFQQFLNSHGYPVTNSGPGSSGEETTKFGSLTRAALIKFQKANDITPAAGYFGPKTRALVNSM